jgi:hypothetical protein
VQVFNFPNEESKAAGSQDIETLLRLFRYTRAHPEALEGVNLQ